MTEEEADQDQKIIRKRKATDTEVKAVKVDTTKRRVLFIIKLRKKEAQIKKKQKKQQEETL